VDGAVHPGDITEGLGLGNIPSGQTKIITYQAQLAAAENFPFGNTTVTVVSTVSDASGHNNSATAQAGTVVTKPATSGATSVSTGLTNNFWADSFFWPLLLAIALTWGYKSGVLVMPSWITSRVSQNKEQKAQIRLQQKISEIKQKEKGD
jgi:hypothetical protein